MCVCVCLRDCMSIYNICGDEQAFVLLGVFTSFRLFTSIYLNAASSSQRVKPREKTGEAVI